MIVLIFRRIRCGNISTQFVEFSLVARDVFHWYGFAFTAMCMLPRQKCVSVFLMQSYLTSKLVELEHVMCVKWTQVVSKLCPWIRTCSDRAQNRWRDVLPCENGKRYGLCTRFCVYFSICSLETAQGFMFMLIHGAQCNYSTRGSSVCC